MEVIKKYFTGKFIILMRMCVFQGVMMICGIVIAHPNRAQILERNVTINVQNVTFEKALAEISQIADVKFVYSRDNLGVLESVSLDVKDYPLKRLLDEFLSPRQIDYKVYEKENSITLRRRNEEKVKKQSYQSQPTDSPIIISGTVLDAITKQPMPGVNVLVKGTTIGTTTDADGKFTIDPGDINTLIFSFIGYKSSEVSVASLTTLEILLEEDVKNLKEVVINAGYYTTTKETQTGNIGKVEAKDIQIQPVSNPLGALIGRVPGLEIVQSTGVQNGNFKVRIRGTNSIANGNNPLYVIDGVPFTSTPLTFDATSSGLFGFSSNDGGGTSPLNSINPSDIESIEVLKDADATSIYGSRGSNGVILITTKKGQAGKTKVDANFYTGMGRTRFAFDELSTKSYLQMRREAFANDSITPDPGTAPDLTTWDSTRYTNWQKALIGDASKILDGQLSISGGDAQTQFSVGGGFHKETTVFPGTNYDQRISTHLSINNTSPNNRLKTAASVNFSSNASNLPAIDLTSKAITTPPNAPQLYTENGDINWTGWNTDGFGENPAAYLKRRYEATTNTLIGSVQLDYFILSNLDFRVRGGYTSTGMSSTSTVPLSSVPTAALPYSTNTTSFSNSTFRNWIAEPQLNWKPKVGAGKFDALVGMQFLNQVSDGLVQTATGFTSEALMKNLTSAATIASGTNFYRQYRYTAGFGRLNYNLYDKYIINITGRRDGSSRFGPGKQFANFGAVGAAWLFSKENFVRDGLRFLSFGKVRGSYGLTGNDQLTDYQYLDTYTSSPRAYAGVIGLTPVRLSNPYYAWETNKKLELGLQLGFLEDRIMTSVAWYRNRSSNQLIAYPLPPTTGFTSIQQNLDAVVQNTGVEIELNTMNIQSTDLSWSTSINVTVPHNKLLKFPGLETSSYADYYVVGQPLNILKTYQPTGVDPSTGLYTFRDMNGDGQVDFNDRTGTKFLGAYFYGGLGNTIRYKGLQLDFTFQFSNQQGRSYLNFMSAPGLLTNQPTLVMDRWLKQGDKRDIQRFGQTSITSTPFQNQMNSDAGVGNASYVRLKNISLAYALPQTWMSKAHITAARIFVRGQNVITFTNYVGLDPETQYLALPPLRTFTAGFSITL
jgi:TonB-linked SusC/RagA family outer membrane protein